MSLQVEQEQDKCIHTTDTTFLSTLAVESADKECFAPGTLQDVHTIALNASTSCVTFIDRTSVAIKVVGWYWFECTKLLGDKQVKWKGQKCSLSVQYFKTRKSPVRSQLN